MDVKDFLLSHKQSSQDISSQVFTANLKREISLGLLGKSNCVPMIPTYLTANLPKQSNVTNIIIDAGGTNFRVCLGSFDKYGKPTFSDFSSTTMPGVKFSLNKEEFFGQIAKNISYLVDKATNIGFCFSYAVDMEQSLDGIITIFSKEIKTSGVLGSYVGAETLQSLRKYSDISRKIVICNDTVATLLGGKCSCNKQYSTYLGYIFGTGTNVSYIENNKNIKKLDLPEGEMIINTEVSNFDKFILGDFDKVIVDKTLAPSQQLIEKVSSGRYLPSLIKEAVRIAKQEKLLSYSAVENEKFYTDYKVNTAELSNFLSIGSQSVAKYFPNASDKDILSQLIYAFIDRSAKIGALLVSAFVTQSANSTSSLPLAIVAEGTTFYKLYNYRKLFEQYLKELLPKDLSFDILGGNELNLCGTLLASMQL
ncbi:MAG: hypothetical protein RR248_04155 [Clostridia bacterium]